MVLPRPLPSFPALNAAFSENSIRLGAVALDREHAIEMAGELLVASGRSTPDYTQSMLDVVAENGPYIVIAPGIALAHGRPSEAVLEIGLSLVTLADVMWRDVT
jgi:PTS system ascorbate-specific IIA component